MSNTLTMPKSQETGIPSQVIQILLDIALPEGGEIIGEIIDMILDIGSESSQLSQISQQISNLQGYISGLPVKTTNMENYVQAIGTANNTASNITSNITPAANQTLAELLNTLPDSEYLSLNSFVSHGTGADYYSLINNLIYYAYNTHIADLPTTFLGIGNCYANDLFENSINPDNNNSNTPATMYNLVSSHVVLATTICTVTATVANYASQVLAALQLAVSDNLFAGGVNASTIASLQATVNNPVILSDLTPVTASGNTQIPFYSNLLHYLSFNVAPWGICGNAFLAFNQICAGFVTTLLSARATSSDANLYVVEDPGNFPVVYGNSVQANNGKWCISFYGDGTSSYITNSTVNIAGPNGTFLTALDNDPDGSGADYELGAEKQIGNLGSNQSFLMLATCTSQAVVPYTYDFLFQWGNLAVVNNISAIFKDYSPGLYSIDVTDADQWWILGDL
ncbi:MAG: hypothetical protein P4L41_07785 [Flavipsychrobacter sp.]|nr:hypothetical protein [Flavipsychrobacter sp.]